MTEFDVVIVGASFAGMALAHHLPKDLKVLLIDAKPKIGSVVESTGLITEHTRQEFAGFFKIDECITNAITTISVIAPGFKEYFFSHTPSPWIYQTDTRALIKKLAETVPKNVLVRAGTTFAGILPGGQSKGETGVKSLHLLVNNKIEIVSTKFLVGADGGQSKVAKVCGLSQNKKFLFGFEEVFFGECLLGPQPEKTIYHFWFGEFSLGYGGWLSPTLIDGKKAFRVGLAKFMKNRSDANGLLKKFLQILLEQKIITINGDMEKPNYVFGGHIPIGGMLNNIYKNNILLIGDAAGFCGAFAADGIKGSIISGKESAKVIAKYLDSGARSQSGASGQSGFRALRDLKPMINSHHNLLHYYKKQLRYRWIWDRMKSDRTFRAMYKVIEAEKENFLEQFCDSKEKRRSLIWTVLKIKNLPKLLKYSWFIFLDFFKKRE